jgi:hypothetical protein
VAYRHLAVLYGADFLVAVRFVECTSLLFLRHWAFTFTRVWIEQSFRSESSSELGCKNSLVRFGIIFVLCPVFLSDCVDDFYGSWEFRTLREILSQVGQEWAPFYINRHVVKDYARKLSVAHFLSVHVAQLVILSLAIIEPGSNVISVLAEVRY